MAETIYTIPINEAFQQAERCPFCTLRNTLEAEVVTYITGPAMMEPDVRQETNRLGFCRDHFSALLAQQNRLSLDLILESHLMAVAGALRAPEPGKRNFFGGGQAADRAQQLEAFSTSCYICKRLETLEGRTASNTVHLWKTDGEFRTRLEARDNCCLPHTAALLKAGLEELGSSQYRQLADALTTLILSQMDSLLSSLQGFARSFDYRSVGTPLTEQERFAIEAAILFLTGDSPKQISI